MAADETVAVLQKGELVIAKEAVAPLLSLVDAAKAANTFAIPDWFKADRPENAQRGGVQIGDITMPVQVVQKLEKADIVRMGGVITEVVSEGINNGFRGRGFGV